MKNNQKKSRRAKKAAPKVKAQSRLPAGRREQVYRAPYSTITSYATSVPVAFDYDLSHSVKQSSLVNGKKSGTLLAGCCPLAAIRYFTLSPTSAFSVFNAAYPTPTSALYLNPTEMFPTGSLEDRESGNYSRFRFRKARYIYQGRITTSSSASVDLGYYPDGSVASGDVTSAFMVSSPGTSFNCVWHPKKVTDITNLLPDDLYYCDADTAGGDSGFRQSYQGALTSYWENVSGLTDAQTVGHIWLEYELELWDNRSFQDLALSSKKKRAAVPKRDEKSRIWQSEPLQASAQLPLRKELSIPQKSVSEGKQRAVRDSEQRVVSSEVFHFNTVDEIVRFVEAMDPQGSARKEHFDENLS